MCRFSWAIKWKRNDFVIKSITRSWLKRCSFHCLPCEGGKPLVPEWYFGQASSISKPPVGVIIAAWNCRCWKVIRSHMVALSPMTLMSRISHLNIKKMKHHKCNRTGLSVLLWTMSFYLDDVFGGTVKVATRGNQIVSDLPAQSCLCSCSENFFFENGCPDYE